VSDIAWSKIDMLSLGWRKIFEQFDIVTARRFHHCKLDFSACDSRDFFRHFGSLVRRMVELETEHIVPKSERAFQVRNRDPSMICGENAE